MSFLGGLLFRIIEVKQSIGIEVITSGFKTINTRRIWKKDIVRRLQRARCDCSML